LILVAVAVQTIPQSDSVTKEPAKQYRIEVFEAWCKSCGICVAFCPKGCLEQDEEGSPRVSRPDLCSGCGWCEIHCPDFAISVRPAKPRELLGEEEAE
jgi:2-oxoglutarate ferredoxin oxidoreductase subunit delta